MDAQDGYYLLTGNDTIVIDTTKISIRYNDGVTEEQRIAIEKDNRLGLIWEPYSVYYDYHIRPNNYMDLLVRLKGTSGVDRVVPEANYNISFFAVPNDPYYSKQGYYWYKELMGLDSMWGITTGSNTVKVAILDSGFDQEHPDVGEGNDLYSNYDSASSWNCLHNNHDITDLHGHGTRMAGIIVAKTNNNYGMAGVAGGWKNRTSNRAQSCFKLGEDSYAGTYYRAIKHQRS